MKLLIVGNPALRQQRLAQCTFDQLQEIKRAAATEMSVACSTNDKARITTVCVLKAAINLAVKALPPPPRHKPTLENATELRKINKLLVSTLRQMFFKYGYQDNPEPWANYQRAKNGDSDTIDKDQCTDKLPAST